MDRHARHARAEFRRFATGLRGLAPDQPLIRGHDARSKRKPVDQRRRSGAGKLPWWVYLGERFRSRGSPADRWSRFPAGRRRGGGTGSCIDQWRHLEVALRVGSICHRQGDSRQRAARDVDRHYASGSEVAIPARSLGAHVSIAAGVAQPRPPGPWLCGVRPSRRRRHARTVPQRDDEYFRSACAAVSGQQ